MKKIIAILIIVTLVVITGLAGNMDHDEYIEANLTPKIKIEY